MISQRSKNEMKNTISLRNVSDRNKNNIILQDSSDDDDIVYDECIQGSNKAVNKTISYI
jgi:hypothetical protein